MDSWNGAFAIGIIRRPHGLKGALKVFSFSGETKHFAGLREVELRRDSARLRYAVTSVEIHNDTPVLFLDGVSDPDIAQTLRGYELWVPRELAAPLKEGEYYVRDLVGLNVVVGRDPIGTVVAVVDGSQAPLLEISREGRKGTLLVPFMDPFVGVPQEQSRTVEILEPWILDTE
ncbi:MAG: 16S rRNA processing protein RimM [Spirochaetaceae bacterium]|nr:MAG: 16S rRNA processing protein RimM [Spirochaetaceae bacterium]